MKRILSWVLGIPAALIVILVAVANRRAVTFSLDPFSTANPWFAAEVPLYVLLIAAIVLGMLIGGTSAWFAQAKWRRAARHAHAEIRQLEAEKAALRRDAGTVSAPPSTTSRTPEERP